ncbi:MAG: RsmD family RNA methyltransferase [Bacteroidales bacterium]|nr:RsmD family RNA methyltransferase [Bacteroidales bacterium]
MNQRILNIEVQQYLQDHADQAPAKVALKKSPFEGVSAAELAEQVDTRQRLKTKLPHWLAADNVYFPPRQNAEQCSSEQTALYKANLFNGKTAIDLTGGFGVDAWALSQHFEAVHYCEMNELLFPVVEHNFKQLECNNVHCHLGDGLKFLPKPDGLKYDLIYLDPARRDEHNRKMVSFADCVPDVLAHRDLLFQYSDRVMLMASPMMDISLALKDLSGVKEVHVVALKHECKELLFILENGYIGEAKIHCVNIKEDSNDVFSFTKSEEKKTLSSMTFPDKYLYEPNVALLKAGAFNCITSHFKIKKLHPFTHLYTSAELVEDFPGKVYEIAHILDYNKKAIAKILPNKKANIKTYNFPNTPEQVKTKLGFSDGGENYLFGVKTRDEKLHIIISKKL